jgi:hypothetical protein
MFIKSSTHEYAQETTSRSKVRLFWNQYCGPRCWSWCIDYCAISLRVLYHGAAGTMHVEHGPTVISNFIHIAVKRLVISD